MKLIDNYDIARRDIVHLPPYSIVLPRKQLPTLSHHTIYNSSHRCAIRARNLMNKKIHTTPHVIHSTLSGSTGSGGRGGGGGWEREWERWLWGRM